MPNELIRADAPPLLRQIREAQRRYAEAIQQLTEATEHYEQTIGDEKAFRELVPDECQRVLIIQRAIQDCAYWDAEMNAAEIRLARLARATLMFHMEGELEDYARR